jgi:hypothetical protein
MAFPILGSPKPSFFDSSGSPLASGTLSILDPDTDENKASYPTLANADAETTPNDNPLTLNARGEPATGLFGRDGHSYKVVLKDSDDATIYTIAKVSLPGAVTLESSTKNPTPASVSLSGQTPTVANTSIAFTRSATIVEDFTLDASASATDTNNNNVLAALIGVLQGKGYI